MDDGQPEPSGARISAPALANAEDDLAPSVGAMAVPAGLVLHPKSSAAAPPLTPAARDGGLNSPAPVPLGPSPDSHLHPADQQLN